ncbi:MAG: hypothetical protein SNJ63_04400 [Sphingomonadaceae bacterium]
MPTTPHPEVEEAPARRSNHPVAIARKVARTVRAETHRLPGHSHHLYVVLCEGFGSDGQDVAFYVGETRYRPERRFQQHKDGIRASGVVRRRGVRLLPRLVQHLNPLSRREAKRLERELADRLRGAGLIVRGGH